MEFQRPAVPRTLVRGLHSNWLSRSSLGSMNELAWQVDAYLSQADDVLELARRLSETPIAAKLAIGSQGRFTNAVPDIRIPPSPLRYRGPG